MTDVPEPPASMPDPDEPTPVPELVVGIGGSAGALDGYERFFTAMPEGSGVAFVVVPHLNPGEASLMPELLARCTTMPVVELRDGMELRPNHVHVAPPGQLMGVAQGRVQLQPAGTVPQMSIDQFFQSLADDQTERAVAVVLSGLGTDGSRGIQRVRERGGLVLVQSPTSAQYASMPLSAVTTGVADHVLPPEQLATELYTLATRRPTLDPAQVLAGSDRANPALARILLTVRNRTGHDFSDYKASTVIRRIDRRLKHLHLETLQDYARHLQSDGAEVAALFQEFLIGVTSFFRDPDAFAVLATHIRQALDERPAPRSFRVWVPGCSTGEEAYSLAILITEIARARPDEPPLDLQVFATDIDQDALAVARTGLYSQQSVAGLSPERLERFFVPRGRDWQVRSDLRDLIVFARHNTFSDPPFTRLNLLSCRNLLIYFTPGLQQQIFARFQYALNPGGLLLLGPSETLGDSAELFEAINHRWKLYRHRAPTRLPASLGTPLSGLSGPEAGGARRAVPGVPPPRRRAGVAPGLPGTVQQLVLNHWAPPAVLVSAQGEIMFVSGRTGAYLHLPEGAASTNVIEMAHPALRLLLGSALRAAAERAQTVEVPALTLPVDGQPRRVEVIVRPLDPPQDAPEHQDGLFVIAFRDLGPAPLPDVQTSQTATTDASSERQIHELERELAAAREYLQVTVEEMDASLEELKSTNEEQQATNEEMQSSNEELTTSKEELQSLNEELITINSEHQATILTLQQANDDMNNLLSSAGIATVFVDQDLRVRRFTPKITQIVHLMAVDVGRPLTDIRSNLRYDHFAEDIRQVLQTLAAVEKDVQTLDGHWFLMRVTPYRTFDNLIDGAAIVFTAIDSVKALEHDYRVSRLYSEAILATLDDPVIVLDRHLRVVTHNPALLRLLDIPAEQAEREYLYDLRDGQFDQPELVRRLHDLGEGGAELSQYLMEMQVPGLGRRILKLNARQLVSPDELAELTLLWGEDVTPILQQVAAEGADAVHDGSHPEAPDDPQAES